MVSDTVVLDTNIAELMGKEDPTAFRNLVKQCTGLNISTEQSTHFLEIFGEQLSAAIIKAKRAFIEKHFK